MKINRIFAIVLRHYYISRKNIELLLEMFFWPAMDIFIWGLTSTYFQHQSSFTSNIIFMIISGVVLWEILWRGQSEISRTLLEELWNRNLVNLFVSPLRFGEWVISIIIVGVIKSSLSFIFASMLAVLVFNSNILTYGFYLFLFILFLSMMAWSVGFFLCGLVMRYTTKIQGIVFGAIAIATPFSAIYYPLSSLPFWVQKIALFFPTSYVFEGAREFMLKGYVSPEKIYASFILNGVYFLLALLFLKKSFDITLEKGLIKAI